MRNARQILATNARLLRSRASTHAIIGTTIAVIAVIAATILSAWLPDGREINLGTLWDAQKDNQVLWILDAMPFLFAIWGQYTSAMISFEASAMVLDQTQDLRTQTAALESQVMHGATHDALTGLPNRILLADRLEQAIHTAHAESRKLAVLLLDLDSFKEINDTLGHYNGDRILKSVATRLQGVVTEPMTLSRFGGDEFAVLIPKISDTAEVRDLAERLQKALSTPFVLEGLRLDVRVSIGGAVYPDHGVDPDTLLKLADVAMYASKENRGGLVLYSSKLDRNSPQRLTLISELRQAIQQDQLELHYQPLIDAQNRRVIGAEALVRWRHPMYGMMLPDEFISLAERTGLIKDLSVWVMKAALNQAAAWHDAGHSISIALNLSARTLLDVEFPHLVAGTLARHDVPAEKLTLEITETTIMEDRDRALEILTRLADMGIRIAIDDFGTGYSSLAYLKQLPVTTIKIDQSFVADMLKNNNDHIIVNATIQLAKNLGLSVVAEGVELEETARALTRMGCDCLQGYLISEPINGQAFSRWLDGLEEGTFNAVIH